MLPCTFMYRFLCWSILDIKEIDLLGLLITLCIIFQGTARHFLKWLRSYNQPAIYGSSNFAISLPKCVTIDVFDYNHLSVLSSGISLRLHLIISQMNNDVKYLFLCVLALSLSVRDIFCIFREISTVSLEKYLRRSSVHFLIGLSFSWL